jgi:hypothetical protein
LVVEGIEDVAPVDGLERRLVGRGLDWRLEKYYLPHFLSDVCDGLRLREVECKAPYAPERQEETKWHFNNECNNARDECGTCDFWRY